MQVKSTPAACSFPGENARSWEALGEARPGQSSLSAGAVRYPGLEARFPVRRREERGCGPVTGKDRASCQSG